MRRAVAAFTFSALLLGSPAYAAPTCQDRDGDTIKCGTDGAMPVGWTLPPELQGQRISKMPEADASALASTIIVIGLLFALIALLPEFDGRRDADWGQDGDDGG